MTRTKIAACLALFVAVAAAVILGPLNGSPAEGKSGTHTYRCMGDDGADGSVDFFINNTTSSFAKVAEVDRDSAGAVNSSANHTIAPHATLNLVVPSTVAVAEFKTASKLLIDGFAYYFNGVGSDTDMVREVRCT